MSQLELNKGDNFIFGLDVSASMGAKDCPGGLSRIEYSKEKTILFTNEASKWDEDGIDLITFGHAVNLLPNVNAQKAADTIGALKANEGSTDTAGVIAAAYKRHKDTASKQTVFFLITDGEPNDRNAVKKVITDISNGLADEHEFAISFLTVGNIAPELESFLTALDDDLKGAKHDIVDVKKLEDVDFMAAFAGALHD
jgi:Mg-chelatase subunit ChlD